MKRVLVTGGTGFIGVEVIRQLAEAGITPRVLVRRPHRAALLQSYDIEPVQGDLTEPDSIRRAVQGVDTVIHLGGRASFESYQRLKPTIVDATAALGRLAGDAGVEHFVFASSLFVYGRNTGIVDAATPIHPVMGYGKAKLEAERALVEIADDRGMTLSRLRFPHVYGPQSILFRQVQKGIATFPGRMNNRCGQLHVEDAARLTIAAGAQRWNGGSAVADDDIVTWTEFFDVLETLYPYFRLVALPEWLGILGGTVLEPLASTSSRPTLYTKDTVVGFNLDLPVAPGLVWSDLGIEPNYPSITDGIPATLDGYVHYRWRHPMLDRRRPA